MRKRVECIQEEINGTACAASRNLYVYSVVSKRAHWKYYQKLVVKTPHNSAENCRTAFFLLREPNRIFFLICHKSCMRIFCLEGKLCIYPQWKASVKNYNMLIIARYHGSRPVGFDESPQYHIGKQSSSPCSGSHFLRIVVQKLLILCSGKSIPLFSSNRRKSQIRYRLPTQAAITVTQYARGCEGSEFCEISQFVNCCTIYTTPTPAEDCWVYS